MTELHNPLFEDEKEFLERQKLEYERALMGDVQDIKQKTRQLGKYAAVGAGIMGGIWLVSKVFGSSKSEKKEAKALKSAGKNVSKKLKASSGRPFASTTVDTAVADDLGFGGRRLRSSMPATGNSTPETDPFKPATDYNAVAQPTSLATRQSEQEQPQDAHNGSAQQHNDASSIMASTFNAFMQSDTGKMLVAQATAVALAFVAKKAGEYLPILKNTDLASSDEPRKEPETRDIEFTYHDDDADAPSQPA
ncbi:hypothetical protein [Hymenobacter psychrophilus]|uniref:Uncharacterized protein n=1 Tax=Hymenobacter psychrophilus TaxID=651662 RepID=A0A1H3GFF1_9BACT|nr:hypothetical protein [Hymenobacter psychrophilus]SDY02016.1 hypothetical protein SAMN04488069_10510 [Hymenobacter psychrophilus]